MVLFHLRRERTFDEPRVQLYAAEILLALEAIVPPSGLDPCSPDARPRFSTFPQIFERDRLPLQRHRLLLDIPRAL